jgi:CubicO group peptidase (beta-lactamase class C family)
MTAISALQCVERGLLNLDEDVSSILPEWKTPQILVGFEEDSGKPILKEAENKLTLRMLLTHQTGLGYGFSAPELGRYCKYANIPTVGHKRIVRISRVQNSFLPQLVERLTENLPFLFRLNHTSFHYCMSQAVLGLMGLASIGPVR